MLLNSLNLTVTVYVKQEKHISLKEIKPLSLMVLTRKMKLFISKLLARLVLRQKGKIYWPIFQLAELVFFRAST